MLKKFYLVFGIGVVLFYGTAAMLGWEVGTPARQTLPPDARNTPGGYRSFHFWHSGFRGGK
jgi:hypothetical protein